MKLLLRLTFFVALLGLGACAQSGYLGDAPINGGAAADPNSVAYFNQTLGDRVLFAVNENTLSTEAQRILDDQADWMLRNMEYTALIEGHADERGTREYNLALGARRAAAVEAYLLSRGISASRLSTISYGKERPLEICSAESCYAQNRRAVTVLSAGAGS